MEKAIDAEESWIFVSEVVQFLNGAALVIRYRGFSTAILNGLFAYLLIKVIISLQLNMPPSN